MAEYDTYEEPENIAYRERAYEKRDKERKTLHWIGGKPKKSPRKNKPKKPNMVDEVMHAAFKDL